MKPAPFAYHAPLSVAEAIGLLVECGDQARLLAGGQALMPLLASRAVRPQQLVDLNRVPELSFVECSSSTLRIGAMTRLRQLEHHPAVHARAPLVSTVAALAGPVQVRNRATLGGALAHADPAAEYPAVAVALGAWFELQGEQPRRLPAEDFFVGAYQTALGSAELLTAVEVPLSSGLAVAIERVTPRATDRALAGAVAVLGGARTRLVLFGVAATPVRAHAAEAVLAAGASADEVADAAVAGLDPPSAAGMRSETRRALARGAVARAVVSARKGE